MASFSVATFSLPVEGWHAMVRTVQNSSSAAPRDFVHVRETIENEGKVFVYLSDFEKFDEYCSRYFRGALATLGQQIKEDWGALLRVKPRLAPLLLSLDITPSARTLLEERTELCVILSASLELKPPPLTEERERQILLANELVALSETVKKIGTVKEGSLPPELKEFGQYGVSLFYHPAQAPEEMKAD